MQKTFLLDKTRYVNNELDGGCISLNGNYLLQAVMISGGLVLISFIVIAILFRHAHRQLNYYIEREGEPETNLFWMERIMSTRFKMYIFLSFMLSLGTTAASYLLPILIAGPTPWWWTITPASIDYQIVAFFLVSSAIMMGFLIPRILYHYLVDEVMEDINTKVNKTAQPRRFARTLKMFMLVAGGSSFYQAVCMFTSCALFIVIKLFFYYPSMATDCRYCGRFRHKATFD